MMRRIAFVLGLAWTFLLAVSIFGEVAKDVRERALPPWGDVKIFCQVLLIQGTVAFLCFAVAAIMGRGGESGSEPKPTDRQDEP